MAEDARNSVKFKIGPNGVDFEASGDSEFIERERERFNEMIPPITRAIPLIPSKQIESVPLLENNLNDIESIPVVENLTQDYDNFAHFNSEMRFNTDIDRVGGVAYFLAIIKKIEPFTIDNIKEELKNARIPSPKNISDVIAKLLAKPFILEDKDESGKRVFRLSQNGLEHFQNYQPKEESRKKFTKSTKRNKTKQSKDYASLSVTVDELHVEQYCDIEKLTKIEEQLLILIYMYTKETIYNTFTKKELQRIMKEKFNLPLTDAQVRRFFENIGTNANKEQIGKEQTLKLLQPGIRKAEEIINNYNHQ